MVLKSTGWSNPRNGHGDGTALAPLEATEGKLFPYFHTLTSLEGALDLLL